MEEICTGSKKLSEEPLGWMDLEGFVVAWPVIPKAPGKVI